MAAYPSFRRFLTQLQYLYLDHTQVNGSITALPQLTSLEEFDVLESQVGVPTEPELTTFTQQHAGCSVQHDE